MQQTQVWTEQLSIGLYNPLSGVGTIERPPLDRRTEDGATSPACCKEILSANKTKTNAGLNLKFYDVMGKKKNDTCKVA